MNRSIKIGFFVVVAIILLSNILPVRIFVDGLMKPYRYETQNSEFHFVLHDNKNKVEWMENRFKEFLKNNPQTNDTILYRTFKKNPLKFWNWQFYMTSDIYDYELKD